MSRSPFPGMDPYLEPHWLDVHTKLVAYSADALNSVLPESLIARTEERIAIESDSDEPHQLSPNVHVLEAVEQDVGSKSANGGVAIAAPFRLVALVDPLTERYVEVIEHSTQRVIAVIEFVSPTNKRGAGLKKFVAKRAELLTSGVHVVEIDLVRAGNWRELLRPHLCPRKAVSLYRATVRLESEPLAVYFFPIHLRDRLPKLPVPLRPGDPKIELDLQPLLEQAYRNGRYHLTPDYTQSLEPPLMGEEAAWAEKLPRQAGNC